MIKTMMFSILIIFLTQCGGGTVDSTQKNLYAPEVVPGLQRAIDDEAGVVCYSFLGKSGIYCLPMEETRLER